MSGFQFEKLDFPCRGDVPVWVEVFHSGDQRGSFTKSFERSIYEKNGIPFELSETFVSISEKNVIRGLHFQLHCPQAKLVSVPYGRVYDVVVDLRPESESFKMWRAVELSGENHRALYIPRGFAHGFASLADNTVMLYQCQGAYDHATDTGILFDDPALGVEWPVSAEKAIHSARDLQLMTFEEYMKAPMRV